MIQYGFVRVQTIDHVGQKASSSQIKLKQKHVYYALCIGLERFGL